MSDQITVAQRKQFKSNMMILTQQKGSRLRDTVTVDGDVKAKETYVDQIGATEAVDVTNRHGATPLVNTPHSRRRLTLIDSDWADLVDKFDLIRIVEDPTNKYAINARHAFGRKMDQRVIDAATGNAYSGEEGGTTVTFDSNMAIAVDYVESGSAADSNLTMGKLRRLKFLLDDGEVDDDGRTLVYTASQLSAMLRDSTLTSNDFNDVKALIDGRITYFMGFNWRRCKLLGKSGNNRTVIAYHQSGILLGVAQDIEVRTSERDDLRYSNQVYVSMSIGATRLEEAKVAKVLCDETK